MVATIDNKPYFSDNLAFFQFFFVYRVHVEDFGTVADMLTSKFGVYPDDSTVLFHNGVQF